MISLFMQLVSIILSVLFICGIETAIAYDNQNKYNDAAKCSMYQKTEEGLKCIEGIILTTQSFENRHKAFSLAIQYWQKRDGVEGFLLSDFFIEVLRYDYKFFFTEMMKYQGEYTEWLSQMGNLSFVWFKEPPSPLELKRKDMIKRLENVQDLEDNLNILRLKLLHELKRIKPRQVD